MRSCRFAMTFAIIVVFGCAPSAPKNSTASKEHQTNSLNISARIKKPLTESQKKEYVDRLLAYVNGQGPEDQLIDVAWFRQQVQDRAKLPAGEQKNEIQTIVERFNAISIAHEARNASQNLGVFTFLRFAERDGRPTALFRLIEPNGHFDYVEVAMTITEEGDRATGYDVYKRTLGDWHSDVQYQSFLFSQPKPNQPALATLLNDPAFDSKQFEQVKSFVLQYGDGKWQEVTEEFAALPESVKRIRIFLVMRHDAATKIVDRIADGSTLADLRRLPAIKASLAELRKFRPDEMMTLMREAEFNRIMGNADETFRLFDKIESAVGGDPHLDVIRAVVLMRDNRLDEAKRLALQALEKEPTLKLAHLHSALISQQAGDFDAVLQAFRFAQEKLGWSVEHIERLPGFESFIASPQFRAWKSEFEDPK